ncbi:MAG: response regulator [Desulfomonile tiedjei]|nr:response regulator [Desulfomonile tiedjei]
MIETKILLVDDEEAFVTALGKRLSARDMTVLSAFTGEAGLAKLDEAPDVDVVLLDVKMPGMDGIAALREIKKAHPITEVIMLTGHATVESAIEGMKLGAFDYLMKPCDLDELVAKVEAAGAKKRAHRAKILEAAGRELRERRGV